MSDPVGNIYNFQKDGKQPNQKNGAQAGVTDASCFSDNSFNCRPEQRGIYRGCGKKTQNCGDAEKLILRNCKTKKLEYRRVCWKQKLKQYP